MSIRKPSGVGIAWAVLIACALWGIYGRSTTPPSLEESVYQILADSRHTDPAARLEVIEKIIDLAGWAMIDLAEGVQRHLAEVSLDALVDEDESVRHAAIRAVSYFPADTQTAVPELLQYLDSDDPEIRLEAAYSQLDILEDADSVPPSAVLAVPIFVERLHHPLWTARQSASKALGRFGRLGVTTEEAVSTLLVLVENDEDRYVRSDVLIALGQIGQPFERISALIAERLDDPDEFIRGHAAIAAGSLGANGEVFIPRLEVMAASDGRSVRIFAKNEIEYIRRGIAFASLRERAGLEDEPNLAVIGSALRGGDPYTRRGAAEILGQFGRQSEQYLPELHNLQDNDPDSGVQFAATVAVYRIERAIQGLPPRR